MPLPLTVSCFSKIQIGFAFLVPAHLGSPGKRAVKRVCVINQLRSSQLFLGQLPTPPQKFEKLIRAFINPAYSLKERQTNSCYLHALRRQRARDTQKSMCITVVTDTSILIAICYVNTRLASPSFPKENL